MPPVIYLLCCDLQLERSNRLIDEDPPYQGNCKLMEGQGRPSSLLIETPRCAGAITKTEKIILITVTMLKEESCVVS